MDWHSFGDSGWREEETAGRGGQEAGDQEKSLLAERHTKWEEHLVHPLATVLG